MEDTIRDQMIEFITDYEILCREYKLIIDHDEEDQWVMCFDESFAHHPDSFNNMLEEAISKLKSFLPE